MSSTLEDLIEMLQLPAATLCLGALTIQEGQKQRHPKSPDRKWNQKKKLKNVKRLKVLKVSNPYNVCLIAWSLSEAAYDTELLVTNNPKVSVDNVLCIYMTGSLRIPPSSVPYCDLTLVLNIAPS